MFDYKRVSFYGFTLLKLENLESGYSVGRPDVFKSSSCICMERSPVGMCDVLRIYDGRNFGWHRPNYKMSLGKIMLAIPIFSYFLTSDALDFVVLILNYFPSQKELCSSFCSCKNSIKKVTCTALCSCAPYAFRFVPTKCHCTTSPPSPEPWFLLVGLLKRALTKESQ